MMNNDNIPSKQTFGLLAQNTLSTPTALCIDCIETTRVPKYVKSEVLKVWSAIFRGA